MEILTASWVAAGRRADPRGGRGRGRGRVSWVGRAGDPGEPGGGVARPRAGRPAAGSRERALPPRAVAPSRGRCPFGGGFVPWVEALVAHPRDVRPAGGRWRTRPPARSAPSSSGGRSRSATSRTRSRTSTALAASRLDGCRVPRAARLGPRARRGDASRGPRSALGRSRRSCEPGPRGPPRRARAALGVAGALRAPARAGRPARDPPRRVAGREPVPARRRRRLAGASWPGAASATSPSSRRGRAPVRYARGPRRPAPAARRRARRAGRRRRPRRPRPARRARRPLPAQQPQPRRGHGRRAGAARRGRAPRSRDRQPRERRDARRARRRGRCCTGSSRRSTRPSIVRMATLGGAEALGLATSARSRRGGRPRWRSLRPPRCRRSRTSSCCQARRVCPSRRPEPLERGGRPHRRLRADDPLLALRLRAAVRSRLGRRSRRVTAA